MDPNTLRPGQKTPLAISTGRMLALEILDDALRTTTSTTATDEALTVVLDPSTTGRIEDIVAHVRCADRTPDYRWILRSYMSWDGINWETVAATYLDYSADAATLVDYAIGSAVTDRTKFGRYMKFVLSYNRRNVGSTETRSSARMSIVLQIKTFGQ